MSSALDEAVAREYKRAFMHCRRIVRPREELAEIPLPKTAEQLLLVYQVAADAELRQSKRRLFDVLDILTTQALPAEGTKMTDGERAKLLSRINYHERLAKDALKDGDTPHAETHRNISMMLRGYLKNRPAPVDVPEPEPVAKRPIRRSYF